PKPVANGVGSMFERRRGVDLREATDGESNTLLVVETARAVPWTKPEDVAFVPERMPSGLGSRHPLGVNVGFADGTPRLLKYTIDLRTLYALLTRDGGEISGA